LRRPIPALAVTALILSSTLGAVAQRGRASPHESVSGTVDGAEMTIVYGRPSMRGRTIFGGLVPYGRVWCPGADEATTLSSTRDLRLGNLTVPAGPHTIWILPTNDLWTLIVSKESSGFHTQYSPSQDLGRVPVRKRDLSTPVEILTFAIVRDSAGGGSIVMSWEQTEILARFSVVQ
jgi:hypothetical protein